MVGGGATGDRKSFGLGVANGLHARGGGDHRNVEPATGVAQDVEVAADAQGLRFLGQPGQAHPGAGGAFVHQAFRLEFGVVGF